MLLKQLLIGCLVVPSVVMAQADGTIRPAPKVGDVTVYVFHNRGDNKQSDETVTVTSVASGQIRTLHQRPDRQPPELEGVSTPEWNPLVSGVSGNKFEPAIELYRFPMKVGDAWKTRYESTNLAGSRSRTELEVKVAAQEKVATPVGDLDAFRIEMGGWINGITWQGAIRTAQTIWYAPAIGRFVKSDYKDYRNGQLNTSTLTELKSHKPAP